VSEQCIGLYHDCVSEGNIKTYDACVCEYGIKMHRDHTLHARVRKQMHHGSVLTQPSPLWHDVKAPIQHASWFDGMQLVVLHHWYTPHVGLLQHARAHSSSLDAPTCDDQTAGRGGRT
jgi:hypothetical protein